MKYVLVWGTSARHYPQHCGLSHNLHDEDVVQIVKKKVRKANPSSCFLFSDWLIHQIFCCLLAACCTPLYFWCWEIECDIYVSFRKRKREEGDDLNHIPMLLPGYLTERRRHHWRHNYMTACDFIIDFCLVDGKNDYRWWYIQRQRFLSWLLMQHRIENSSWALSGAPIFFCHPSVVTSPPPLLNNSFYQLWSVHLWFEEKQKVKETGTASWKLCVFWPIQGEKWICSLGKTWIKLSRKISIQDKFMRNWGIFFRKWLIGKDTCIWYPVQGRDRNPRSLVKW